MALFSDLRLSTSAIRPKNQFVGKRFEDNQPMIKLCMPPAILLVLALAPAPAGAQAPTENPVVRLDPALDALVSGDAKLERVATGFGFTEGNIWVSQGKSGSKSGYMLFSDIPANVIYKMTPDGKSSIHMEKSGYTKPDIWRVGFIQTNGKERSDPAFEEFPMIGSNGLALDRQGRLIIATWAGRSIDRIESNGKRTVLADSYDGKRFGGTNDVVVKKDGAIYFTDTFGGLRLREKDPRKELDFNGVYMWKDGKLTLLIKDIPNTNGLAFSPDEKYLYVNGSRDKYVKRYDVKPDGTLANGTMFIDISSDPTPGITDGLKVDVKGNVWETAAGGVWIISPEGKHLGTIRTPELAANVEFGDADHKTLYIAARTSIYKIRVNVPGIP
jgi:gluconolactonase